MIGGGGVNWYCTIWPWAAVIVAAAPPASTAIRIANRLICEPLYIKSHVKLS
jgi:hypothetical protein